MQKIVKGDHVKVMLGKDSGKTGDVERVLEKDGKAFVAGINVYKRHIRRQNQIEGGVIDMVKPVNISNLQLVCPKCKKPTRVGFEVTKDGKVRVCKKCKAVIERGKN